MEICIISGRKFMQREENPEVLSDAEIISLFQARDETAISAVSRKFGNYCGTVISGILKNPQDAEECLNDTWMRAWETIPPHEPRNLAAFMATIAKNISLNRYKDTHAKKRGSGEISLVLEELTECCSRNSNVEKEYEHKLLVEAVNEFLRSLPKDKRDIFVLRYWFCLSTKEITKKIGAANRSSVSVTLMRTRKALAKFLKKQGFLEEE